MRRARTALLFIIGALFGSWPSHASAQVSLAPAMGWNQGIERSLHEHIGDRWAGPVLAAGWRSGSWREPGRAHRFGIDFSTQLVKTFADAPQFDRLGTRYRSTTLQFSYERAPWRGSQGTLVLGVGIGFAWVRHKDGFGPGTGEDWDTGIVPNSWLLSPGVQAIVPVYGPVSLAIGARANLYSGEPVKLYPFRSGAMLLAGVEYFFEPPSSSLH